jgi:Fe-S oxidoreductase
MTTELATKELERKYNKLVGTAASNMCAHCGWCMDSCHVYMANHDPEVTPVAKAERIRHVYKKKHDWMSKIFPFWTGAKKLTDEELEKWVNLAYRDCTLCERCVVNCPMGVETPQLIAAARSALVAAGKAPEILTQLADMAISREENAELYRDFFLEQIKEIEKQLQEYMGTSDASIPIEKEGARILYVPLSGAHTILPEAIIFNAAHESWTLSMFEASNYGVFLGDAAKAKRIAERIINEAKRLKVQEVVLTECGHAYTTMRWEAPKWFGGPLPFRVRSILEVLDEYVHEGRLKFDPSKNSEPVTYHDSCNLGRKGGLLEEPRRVLRAIAQDFREMTPNRLQSICCGGGSGLVAIAEWSAARIKAGKPKADQIRQTGAKVVVTSCDNCRHQITELSEHYNLGIKVTSLCELTVQALVLSDDAVVVSDNSREPTEVTTS